VLRDLVALSAIPAMLVGREPDEVAGGLADCLFEVLQLDFVFVRLSDPGGAAAVGVTRGNEWTGFEESLERRVDTSAPFPRREAVFDVGDGTRPSRALVIPIGVSGEAGLVAASSQRTAFPTEMDRVLLSLAANHAATAFENARLIQERDRAEAELRNARNELEVRVVERTAELNVANAELNALRRVATVVAQEASQSEVFSAIAQEIALLLGIGEIRMVRYDDDHAVVVAGWGPDTEIFPVGAAVRLEDDSAASRAFRTRQPVRIDDYATVSGPVAEAARPTGVRSVVATPIWVGGQLWGAMTAGTTEDEPLPPATEFRLAQFTELLATAIANAQARGEVERLADEQAALRRVATLVAQGVQPEAIFSAVGEEIGRLFGSSITTVGRFEPDAQVLVALGVGTGNEGVAIGSRWELDDHLASAQVFRTGRSVRVDEVEWSAIRGPLAPIGHRLGVASTVASPIFVEGRLWGVVSVSDSKQLPPEAEGRLEKFSELIATAIANAESKAELAASRRRIVAASDDARRRIERDLHDGVQQELVSLRLVVNEMEAGLRAGDALKEPLASVSENVGSILDSLVEIARGIHPSILSHGGIGAALNGLARRSTVPVELDVRIDVQVPDEVEVAAYYVASEALTNVAKHACASVVHIDVTTDDGTLTLAVRDDGVGGADARKGSGLAGLQDRVEALSGTITIDSSAGSGTCVAVTLPIATEPDREIENFLGPPRELESPTSPA
jgi:signal transduction histidine kinase